MRALVIGVGSPNGDDAIGLRVAERLAREELPPGVVVIARDRPGLALLDDLESAPAAVLVDGLRSADAAGVVHRIAPAALARARLGSSHALCVAETLALAVALGRRLPPLRIVAVAIGSLTGDALSPPVAAALETACAETRAALAELLSDA